MSGTGEVKPQWLLQGKSNFAEWQRRFTHVAKAKNVLQLLNGIEKIILERPTGDTFLEAETNRVNNTNDTFDIARVTLQYNEAYEIWRENKEKVKTAGELLHEWISKAISIEIVDCKTVADAYQHITTKYKVDDDRAREDLLDKSISMKLGDFSNMQEYLNEHRIVAAELKKLSQEYSDRRKVDNIILGLPNHYDAFKRQYRLFHRREEKPDVEELEEILLEEADEVDKKKKVARRSKSGQVAGHLG